MTAIAPFGPTSSQTSPALWPNCSHTSQTSCDTSPNTIKYRIAHLIPGSSTGRSIVASLPHFVTPMRCLFGLLFIKPIASILTSVSLFCWRQMKMIVYWWIMLSLFLVFRITVLFCLRPLIQGVFLTKLLFLERDLWQLRSPPTPFA